MSTGAITIRSSDAAAYRVSGDLVSWSAGPAASAESATNRPRTAYLPLGALPTAVPCGRLYTRAVLGEWGLAAVADQGELVVSELLTNSVMACTGPDGRPRYDDGALPVVHLRLTSDHGRVRVEVWDSVPGAPAARRARPDEEGGRGLALVEALSDRWAWATPPGWPGKVVWAELRP